MASVARQSRLVRYTGEDGCTHYGYEVGRKGNLVEVEDDDTGDVCTVPVWQVDRE